LIDKKIGFIRISTFDANLSQMMSVSSFLEKQIPSLQQDTDALILDLTDNGGGFVCYGELIASFFIDKPIAGVMDSVKPTRQWAIEFESMLDWVEDAKERVLIAAIIAEIRASLERGDELTNAFRICSPLEHLVPATDLGLASATYTHPMLLLVNEFSASMADAFPAMLQDAGNAKVFGAQTMGLGGGVVQVGPLGNSDITIYMTNSLAWRERDVLLPSGSTTRFIENIGVIPDYPYDVTVDDFFTEYSGYRAAIESALMDMLNK
jgi:C-terminal processing protease CtpA/Prc